MRIINRTANTYRYLAYHGADSMRWGALGTDIIRPNFEKNVPITDLAKVHGIKVALRTNTKADHRAKDSELSKAYKWGTTLLIVPYGPSLNTRNRAIIDWQGLERAYIWPGRGRHTQSGEDTSTNAANYAAAALESFAALLFSIPSGIGIPLQGIFGVFSFLMGTNKSASSQGFSLAEMKTAFGEIVREAIDEDYAEKSAELFVNISNYLGRMEHLANEVTGLGEEEIEDFETEIERNLSPSSNARGALTHMLAHPEDAQSIFPAFMLGIAAFAKMAWYDFVRGAFDGNPVTASRLTFLQADNRMLITALQSVRDKVVSEVEGVLTENHLGIRDAHGAFLQRPLGEAQELAEAMYKDKIGFSDPDPINRAINELVRINGMYESDIRKLEAGETDLHSIDLSWLST